ncbi:alpha/beta fold hydrolase [Actinomycetospora termitidis]|uniref:Alpha/beta hydrolase n=1 Tax=Actinomycetospora termitidis TaxID=3053470 RepID=A0ABT7MAA9_9PSEU|nr:alpha/beta hydrolase [Actinomycetospora sp. Odt1-22]MDL5157596.1 alpha/beta hydrolase [Actinomycetospora sp. Odt1-22]
MENGDVRIHYEERGEGFPVLTFAPGGMRSAIEWWSAAPWDVPDALAGDHRVLLTDQRNAGESWAPVTADDGWDSYTDDHLALLDHLGIERCHLLGMCIGGSFIANLVRRAPDRVAAAVVLQPIGLDGNRELFHGTFDDFAEKQAPDHPEASEDDWRSFRENLYGADHTLFSVPDEAVARLDVPLLVFAGGDEPHPASASEMLAEVAPQATLVERWKAPEYNDAARESIASFFEVHTPA